MFHRLVRDSTRLLLRHRTCASSSRNASDDVTALALRVETLEQRLSRGRFVTLVLVLGGIVSLTEQDGKLSRTENERRGMEFRLMELEQYLDCYSSPADRQRIIAQRRVDLGL